jgi:hypothetical protein
VADIMLDLAAMARLAKVLDFICGPADSCTIAVKAVAASGLEPHIKKPSHFIITLKSSYRTAALGMLRDELLNETLFAFLEHAA